MLGVVWISTSLGRIIGKRGSVCIIFLATLYVFGQAVLYAQDRAQQPYGTTTPWDHLTLEGALAIAVAVQYKENREREKSSTQMSTDAAKAIAQATQIMGNVTSALEKLSSRIEACPARVVTAQHFIPHTET